MNTFTIPRKKVIELCLLPVFISALYFFYPTIEAMVLFSFGYIWNWTASNNLDQLFQNKRYRMSMIKLVVNLQNLVLRPFQKAPEFVKSILKIFPAGIFWSLVIYLNESNMPWWSTFLGSLIFELVQVEINFFKRRKEVQ